MSAPDDPGTAVALRDGSRVVVRPVRPDDRELLLAGFERLATGGAGAGVCGRLGQAARASASSSSRNPSAKTCGSGTSPASVRKPTVTFPA